MNIYAFCPQGYDGYIVEVECDIRLGLPYFTVVGLPDSAVREARNRVQSAIIAIKAKFPRGSVLISLSPGGIKKLGSGYDLAIAAAILYSSGQISQSTKSSMEENWLFLGELGLNGRVRVSSFDYAALLSTCASKFDRIIVSQDLIETLQKISLPNLDIYCPSNLSELLEYQWDRFLYQEIGIENTLHQEAIICNTPALSPLQFTSDPQIQLALMVSAAGYHNLLLYGAPGSGKTTTARSIHSLLPLSDSRILREQLRIHVRNFHVFQQEIRATSFREPHHSSSAEGILGGGKFLGPGEISLAHGGVLLLDESPEFHRNVLQNLREPLEGGSIRLVRADSATSYPCKAIFIFTMNLCPCGNRGRSDAYCMCSEKQIHQYWSRLGGAIYDRIEIKVFFTESSLEEGISYQSNYFKQMQNRVIQARRRQMKRFESNTYNAYLSWEEICSLPELNQSILYTVDEMQKKFFLSGRGRLNLLRLSLTILDLDNRPTIETRDLDRALSLMRPENFNEYF